MGALGTWLLVAVLAGGPTSPNLRHRHNVAVLPVAADARATVTCVPHGAFTDPASCALSFGHAEFEPVVLPPGESRVFPLTPPRLGALGVLAVDCGWSLSTVAVDGARWALVCDLQHEASFVGAAELWLYQPAGGVGKVAVGASVKGEGCRVVLSAGEQVLADASGDFDQAQTFALPAVSAPRVVRLQLLKPNETNLNLDDVELTLSGRLAPFLAPAEADAIALGEHWVAWDTAHSHPSH